MAVRNNKKKREITHTFSEINYLKNVGGNLKKEEVNFPRGEKGIWAFLTFKPKTFVLYKLKIFS